MDPLLAAPTLMVIGCLLVLMFAGNEAGYRLGRVRPGQPDEPESTLNVANGLKASVFGLVALLLGFSFSGTASRYDIRRRAVLEEANAIGTCHLRAGLLENPARDRIRAALRSYTRARLEVFRAGTDRDRARMARKEMDRHLGEMWAAIEATRNAYQAVLVSQIVPAANAVYDTGSTQAWAEDYRLPAPVLLLLGVAVVVSCMLIGHSCGKTGRRHIWLWLPFNVLFALVLYVVLDYDRPRRGLIRTDQQPLIALEETFGPPE